MTARFIVGDSLTVLRTLPDASCDLVLTSCAAMVDDMPKSMPVPGRWWEKVDRRGDDECWPWIASRNKSGYGRFQVPVEGGGQLHTTAHRYGYAMLVGPIPDGLHVLHHCDNPPCVNPAHLFLGTNLDNNADKVAKGRHALLWGRPLNRARQTECWAGHPLSGDNLKTHPDTGHRSCRRCAADRAMRYYYERGPAPRPLVTCVDCGEARPHRAHGRCQNCDAWWRRKGEPRPRRGVIEGARSA